MAEDMDQNSHSLSDDITLWRKISEGTDQLLRCRVQKKLVPYVLNFKRHLLWLLCSLR